MNIRIFLFSDNDTLNTILNEQFELLPSYMLIAFDKFSELRKISEFNRNDIVLFHSNNKFEIKKVKNLLSDKVYFFPAIVFGSSEEIVRVNKDGLIFLKTPFSFLELLKNIEKTILQRDIIEYSNLKHKKINLDMAGKYLKNNNQNIKLTDKESKIIWHLIKAKGNPIGQEFLLNKVWGYNKDIETKTLTTHIYTLRKKIISLNNILSIENSEEGYFIK